MQTFILPDYLDGSKKAKNIHLDSIVKCCALSKYMSIVDNTQIAIDLRKDDPYVDGVRLGDLVPYISSDESLKVFLRAYKAYVDNPSKNFIIEKDLVKALGETKLDIKIKYLPNNFKAFIELKELFDNDGDLIKGIFVDISENNGRSLYLGMLVYHDELKSYAVSHLSIPLNNPEENIDSIIKNYKEINSLIPKELYPNILKGNYVDIPFNLKKVVTKADYYKHLHTIFNAILYIHNSPELCVEDFNKFSEKISKRNTQKNIYTSKKFIILGRNFVFPREYTCGEVGVSGHFRWQPYGPNRSLIKHIYIKPHTRNYITH